MLYYLSMLAALTCAFLYGVSSVLQKVGADKQKRAKSLNPGLLVRLLGNGTYVLGTGLDLAAWPLSVFAVQNLPLFVVEPIISFSVVVTVAVERIFMKRRLNRRSLAAIGMVFAGLIIIATQAGLESARPLSHTSMIVITIFGPLLLVVLGAYFARIRKPVGAVGLSLCAGSAFGMDSVLGRVLTVSHPLWHTLYEPALIAMAVYSIIAVLFFTIALQRTQASIVNATVVGAETILPTVLGIWLLGDSPRGGSYVSIMIGAAVTIIGTVAIALAQNQAPRKKAR
jgi:uncharacterized membrane protein